MTWLQAFASQPVEVWLDYNEIGTEPAPDGDIDIIYEFAGGVRVIGDGTFIGHVAIRNHDGTLRPFPPGLTQQIFAHTNGTFEFSLPGVHRNNFAGFSISLGPQV